MANGSSIPVKEWITVPAVITLLVTLLRLIGELNDWSPTLFGKSAGGGGSLIGIVWLIPIFGIYFGWKLARSGHSEGAGKTAALYLVILVAAFAVLTGASVLAPQTFGPTSLASLVLVAIVSIVAVYLTLKAGPELGNLLLKYGLAARIPVVVIMLIAIYANWGTHYDVPPDDSFPDYGPFLKWVLIGVLPQMTVWIAFTSLVGGLFASVTAALVKEK